MTALVERRIIYVLVLIALALPLLLGYSIPPARMAAAEKTFEIIEKLEMRPGQLVFLAFDYGPNTIAENGVQSEVVLEHLMRRKIPAAVFAMSAQSDPFLASVPEKIADRLHKENPELSPRYGVDWVNLGYRPGMTLWLQSFAKSRDIVELLARDAKGNNLRELPIMKGVKTLKDIPLLGQFTGYVGFFDMYVQFFQNQETRPIFVHGCTSITIPEAYIFVDSGQLNGLLEGVAGAAWYSKLLQEKHPAREKDSAMLLNTGLGVAHLVIIVLVLLGNLPIAWRAVKGMRAAEGGRT